MGGGQVRANRRAATVQVRVEGALGGAYRQVAAGEAPARPSQGPLAVPGVPHPLPMGGGAGHSSPNVHCRNTLCSPQDHSTSDSKILFRNQEFLPVPRKVGS